MGSESKKEWLLRRYPALLTRDSVVVRPRSASEFGKALDSALAAVGASEGFDVVLDAVLGGYFYPGFDRYVRRPDGSRVHLTRLLDRQAGERGAVCRLRGRRHDASRGQPQLAAARLAVAPAATAGPLIDARAQQERSRLQPHLDVRQAGKARGVGLVSP